MAKKTSCPITRADFRAKAKPLTVTINDKSFVVLTKEFSTGSLGWNLNEKMVLDIGGTPVSVQIGMNITVVGSKDLPQDTPASTPAPVGESAEG